MLAAGFSLSKLCQTVGLESVEKAIFPFDLLEDDESFLKCEELPAQADKWFSRLTQDCPTQERVDEARREFARLGFANVEEYLLHYLKADLDILLQSVDRLFGKLQELVGLHPVAVRKFSLSGFSFLAAQYSLIKECRPGCFVNNHVAIFNSLKKGMRGGVSMVCRNVMGDRVGRDGEGQAACNAHLLPEEEGQECRPLRPSPEKLYTQYYDISSLYPSSGVQTYIAGGESGLWPLFFLSLPMPPTWGFPPPQGGSTPRHFSLFFRSRP